MTYRRLRRKCEKAGLDQQVVVGRRQIYASRADLFLVLRLAHHDACVPLQEADQKVLSVCLAMLDDGDGNLETRRDLRQDCLHGFEAAE